MAARTGHRRRIYPVVLAGGTGTRLWPVSRTLSPKQFMPLASVKSMFVETIGRVVASPWFHAPLIVCNDKHRFIVAEQMREQDIRPEAVVVEPVGRNTAPAAAAAALILEQNDPDAVLLALPADHVIRHPEKLLEAIDTGVGAAGSGKLVTFGVAPERPETGYGYIRRGPALEGRPGCFAVERFVEKPDAQTARSYLEQGGFDLNSGIFLFRASRYREELERFEPEILSACRKAVRHGEQDLDFFRLDHDAFASAPSLSIDYAVMEHTRAGAVVPVDMGWSDIGSWSALWEIATKDGQGNVVAGDVVISAVRNSYVRSEGPLLAVIGLCDVVIVATGDVVLAAAADKAQEVKTLVERLSEQGRPEPVSHPEVHRPWGSYRIIDAGERFQVKRITVKPGGKLSLQRHKRRAEHWVVVNGTARVTRGEETLTLKENESVYIPLGEAHRLENPGEEPLRLIEVQSGSYLGEDDIVRLDDIYGRN